MANINKIVLPNGEEYQIEVQSKNIEGIIPYTKGGTGANSLEQAKINLGIDIEEISNFDIENLK